MSDENPNDTIEQDVEQGEVPEAVLEEPADALVVEPPAAEPVAVTEAAVEDAGIEEPSGIGWTPFLVYLAAWVVLSVGAVVLLRPAALEGGARWAPEYPYAIYAGIGMMAVGPLLAIVVWLATRARREIDARHDLFVSAFVKGALVTFTGVVLWIVALYVLDLFTSGIIV